MSRKLALSVLTALLPAVVAVSACGGGAAPTPTTKPAAPATTAPAATKPAATAPAAAATKPAATQPAAPAATSAAPATTGGDATAGKAIFEQNCNGCHPGGEKGVGPMLKGRNLPAERIRTQVRNGGGAMPPFPPSRISDQQLNDLVAYVQSLK